MRDLTFEALAPEYEKLWATCSVLPSRKTAADTTAARILANKARYETVSQATTVPWFVIGLIHAMEGGLNFKTHLHNGDPLTARTRQVPRARPKNGKPPFTWEESAIDALTMDGLDKVKEWTPERLCFELEGYNGWGYRKYHSSVNTPYLWSGTNNYVRGKYVADGKWDATAVSGQSGAIAILKCVMGRDTEVAALLNPQPIAVASDSLVLEPSTEDLIDSLAAPTPVTAKDLGAVSRKLGLIMKLRKWAMGAGAGGTALSFGDMQEKAGQLHDIAQYFRDNAFLLLIGGCVVGVVAAQALISWSVEDANSGRYVPSKGE